MKTRFLLYVLVMVLGSVPLFGQNVSSSLRGVLVDPSGAVVPGASCTLTNRGTAATLATKSDAGGSFTFLNVLAGTYSLRVEAAGFRPLDMKDIMLTANEVRSLGNVTLTVGEVQQAVSVTAETTPVQLASAEKSGLLTSQQLDRLALKGRDFMGLLITLPGIVDTGSAAREATDPTAIGGTVVNGGRDSQKNFTVDGIVDMDTGSNETLAFEPPMDTIAEVKVLTSNYQAEYGRNSGGVITVITKSGTQSFHGAAYDYYRNETLNANSWGNNRTGTLKAPYRYRITGYNLGGPVYIPGKFNTKKDKLFFFWSQEFTGYKKNYATQLANTPTDLERSGDFSKSLDATAKLISITDPLTGRQFPNNVIPSARISPLGQAVLKFFPAPNYTSPDPRYFYLNHRDTYSGQYDRRNDLIRLDYNVTPMITFYYRYTQDHDLQIAPWGLWITGSPNWLISPFHFGQPGHGHAAHLTKTFSPTLVNDFSFGKTYNKVWADISNPSAVARSAMGNFPSWFGNATYIPSVTFGATYPPTPINASIYAYLPYDNYTDIWIVNDNLSKVWGRHSIKTGVYYEKNGKYSPCYLAYRGSVSFARSTLNPFDSGDGFSNALLGNYYSYSEANKRLNGHWWFWNLEWYVQDNWRVTKRLTLDYGLRFEHLPGVTSSNGVMVTFVPSQYSSAKAPVLYRPTMNNGVRSALNPLTGQFSPSALIGYFAPGTGSISNGMVTAGNGIPDSLITATALDVTPRFGLALDVLGNGKLALHTGFGTFKDRTEVIDAVYASALPPIGYTPISYFGDLGTLAQTTGYLSPSGLSGILTGRAKTPTTANYSFGLQTLVKGTSIDVSYVGAFSRHLWINRAINHIAIGAHFNPANADPTTGGVLPDNFFRPYMGWGSINAQEFAGTSNYNSLQVKIEHRYRNGLQYGVAYTKAKALGTQSSEYDSVSGYFSPRQWNYGRLGQDRSQMLVVNYSYDVPGLSKKLGVKPLGYVTDNWTLSGITSFISGSPLMPGFSTTDGQDITGSSEGARITVIAPNPCDGPHGLNLSAFARTPKGSFGNASPGMCQGPGTNNWDMAIAKRVPLGSEKRYLQYRLEMFNAFNHTQYSGIDTGFQFNPAGQQVSTTLGTYTSARMPRIIEMSLRLMF
jgi:outer membrane receptor protein involved in Fe transport